MTTHRKLGNQCLGGRIFGVGNN